MPVLTGSVTDKFNLHVSVCFWKRQRLTYFLLAGFWFFSPGRICHRYLCARESGNVNTLSSNCNSKDVPECPSNLSNFCFSSFIILLQLVLQVHSESDQRTNSFAGGGEAEFFVCLFFFSFQFSLGRLALWSSLQLRYGEAKGTGSHRNCRKL